MVLCFLHPHSVPIPQLLLTTIFVYSVFNCLNFLGQVFFKYRPSTSIRFGIFSNLV